jgi:hypothetical protein
MKSNSIVNVRSPCGSVLVINPRGVTTNATLQE